MALLATPPLFHWWPPSLSDALCKNRCSGSVPLGIWEKKKIYLLNLQNHLENEVETQVCKPELKVRLRHGGRCCPWSELVLDAGPEAGRQAPLPVGRGGLEGSEGKQASEVQI